MQRARRVALVAVLALFSTLVVAGCRTQPGVAAYVGDLRIHESRVDEIGREARASAAPDEYVPTGAQIVATLVTLEVVRRLAGELTVAPVALTPEELRLRLGAPAGEEYLAAVTQTEAYLRALVDRAVGDGVPGEPNDANAQDEYRRALALGAFTGDFAGFKTTVSGIRDYRLVEYREIAALRDQLVAAAQRYGVRINPRYRPVSYPMLGLLSDGSRFRLVALPLDAEGRR